VFSIIKFGYNAFSNNNLLVSDLLPVIEMEDGRWEMGDLRSKFILVVSQRYKEKYEDKQRKS
jgi:hypothetical protein